LRYLQGKGTSLGGMRPRCTIVDQNGRLAIGRFPSVDDTRSVTRGEVLALKLAQLGGIDAAPARIVSLAEVPVAVIRRERESKTWLSEEDGPITDVGMLLARAPYFALDQNRAQAVMAEVHAAVVNWRQVALGSEVGLRSSELDDFAAAFEHGQTDATAALLER
jgi:hypothetical protein